MNAKANWEIFKVRYGIKMADTVKELFANGWREEDKEMLINEYAYSNEDVDVICHGLKLYGDYVEEVLVDIYNAIKKDGYTAHEVSKHTESFMSYLSPYDAYFWRRKFEEFYKALGG